MISNRVFQPDALALLARVRSGPLGPSALGDYRRRLRVHRDLRENGAEQEVGVILRGCGVQRPSWPPSKW
jgi:hypothetical protein